MHVGLNLIFLVPGETGGMEIYARELIRALRNAAPDMRFTAFVNRETAGEDMGVDRVALPVRATDRAQWVRGEQLVLPRAAARAGCDLVHSLASTAPATGRFRRVTTVHDLHFLTASEAHFGLRALGMRALVPLGAHRSHRIITDSAFVRAEIVERLRIAPDRIDVVPLGLGRPPAGPVTPEAELRARHEVGERPLLLSLSAKRPHKNLAGVLRALARIAPERRPVALLAGYETPHEAELRELADSLGLSGDVRFTGWMPDADAEGLLAMSAGFVFPSFSEGFGLPVLEAMARGVPVACSDRSSLPEVAGDAALLFDPADAAQIAAAIERLLYEPGLAERLSAAGRAQAATFTWQRTAELTLDAYRRA